MCCAYTRPKYQVSVYKTIGTLVYKSVEFEIDRQVNLIHREKR